jgi:PBSX family phage terminase large subunit
MSEAASPEITSQTSSVPSLQEFNPQTIPFQYQVIRDVRRGFDYSDGTGGVHQVLLSGAVGSAKTLLLAHLVVTHCLMNPGAVVGLGRLAMPRLKETLLDVILKHVDGLIPIKHNQTTGTIFFPNRSKILSFSWKDKNYKKFRSYEFSLFAFEEMTENDTDEAYLEIIKRLGRLSHVRERLFVGATNPDDPAHWVYNRFILAKDKNPLIHVYYSRTKDNPFLPASYVRELERILDPKMARRMLEGEWLSITQDVIYYNYTRELNFKAHAYTIDPRLPVHLSFDFNIAIGKPMSAVAYQIDREGRMHLFEEFVVEGARTESLLEEAQARGFFDTNTTYLIHGDATGSARNTASKHSNYDLIREFLSNYKRPDGRPLSFRIEVPKINPPIRTRHQLVNAAMKNTLGEVRLFVYEKCKVTDEGFRLTKLKAGGQYVEDDSKSYQHITTAVGYGLHWHHLMSSRKEQGTVQL